MKKTKQAYYLMDHRGIGPNRAASSFDYDYRFAAEADKALQANVATTSLDSAQRVIRKFQPFSEGKAVCIFKMNIDGDSLDGTYYSFINEDEKEIIRIETKDGNFVCDGKVICPAIKGGNRAKIKLDADNNCFTLSINGSKSAGFKYLMSTTELSGFVSGIEKGHICSLYVNSLVMTVNYAVNETFLYEVNGVLPEEFEVAGNVVCGGPDGRNVYPYIDAKAGNSYSVTRRFDKEEGVTNFESLILLPDGADGAYMELLSGDKVVFRVESKDNTFVTGDGEFLMNFTSNIWQWLRVEADPIAGKAFVRIDTKAAGVHKFMTDADYFDGIRIGIDAKADTVMRFTDIYVYNYDKPDDYVPEPKPLDTGDYNIGMNVCNLWREGGHGWDAITALPDHEPYMGYYDEGIEETADWETKYLLEHGIKFQHPCWYCPQWDISEPLFPGRFHAINRGLLASRYSHMMKFTFMWENTSGQVKNFEQFKEFIWPYWKEYYFSNPNFLVIDNKPVMTTYAIGLYVSGFGGVEGGKKALEFMNEDIKTLGFDGLIMLFHDAHERSMEVLGPVAEMGAAGLYGYHWNDLGKDPEHQKKRMTNNRDALGFYVFPTLAMGFNNLGWGGHRHGVSTLEQFKDAALWMKNEFLPGYGDSWKSKYFFVATWNEYGEGHFVIPSTLHGFGYLDIVAEVFGKNGADYSLNVKPTENQKKRIGHLYRQDRSIIKPIRVVDEREKHIPTETVIKWDMSDKETAAKFIPSNDILDYSIDGGVIHGRRNGGRGDISLKLDNISINLDDVDYLHIRMRSTNENNSMWFGYVVNDKIGNVRWVYTEYTKSENYSDFYVPKSLFTIKEGIITALDICPMRLGWGEFDIELIEFLKYADDDRPYEVYVDGKRQYFDFEPEYRNDDLYITLSSQRSFLKDLNLIYEASRKKGTFRLLSVDKDIRLTYGLDHFTVNGKAEMLTERFSSKDGLPVIPLKYFAKLFEYKVEVNGKNYNIITK